MRAVPDDRGLRFTTISTSRSRVFRNRARRSRERPSNRRGGSGAAADYELAREAEDLVALMESIDDPVTVLGHSGGAVYALEAALRTDRVDRLILNEPPIAVGDHELEVTEAVALMEELLAEGKGEEVVPEIIKTFTGTFPDLRVEIRRRHLAGDGVSVIEYTFSGTNGGELEGIAPTGRKMEVVACSVAEIRDGWIVRERDYYDNMAMMTQLGLAEG